MHSDLWDKFIERDYDTCLALAGERLREAHALDLLHLSGLALVARDDRVRGMDFLAASLSLAAAKPDWFANAGIACMEKEWFDAADMFLRNGVEEHPNDIRLRYMRGLCRIYLHMWAEAIEDFDKTLELDPKFYHANLSRGYALHMLGQHDAALACYDAMRDIPLSDQESVVNNRACIFLELGDPHRALALLEDRYGEGGQTGTLYNRSFLYLGMGRWPEGWHLYRHRDTVNVKRGVPEAFEAMRAKSLAEIAGKHLLFFHEQGLGDSLMMVRYAAPLARIASKLTIGVPKALLRLFECLALEPPADIIAYAGEQITCEVAIPTFDAPSLFGTTPDTIPPPLRYNLPHQMLYERRLPARLTPDLRVGLCWAGASRLGNSRAHSIDRRRSIPFEMLDPLLRMANRHSFYSLQLSDHHKDDPRLRRPLGDDFDMLDTACIIAQLDLVITIDSAIAHLAASLGKEVWLLSRFDGCWRWFWDGRTDTPWYPTMRIFRQQTPHSWPDVIAQVSLELALLNCRRDAAD